MGCALVGQSMNVGNEGARLSTFSGVSLLAMILLAGPG